MKNLELLLKCNIRSELARRHLIDFTLYTKPDYKVNWHHALLAKYLDLFALEKIKNLMVFMPPQHGKSELTSRRTPAFILGKNPDKIIVGSSYSSDLAISFNRAVQRIIDSPEYADIFPETKINSQNVVTNAKGSYLRNAHIFEVIGRKGSYKSVGVGSALTGNPADIGIIDDPVKDAVEAKSAIVQQRNWEWYNDVFLTRLHNRSQKLLTMTRWDENDLAGKILKAEPNDWVVLTLPAIKETNDNPEDPREIGEALWEEQHSKEKILKVRNQSKRTFMSLYQQKPRQVASGGEFFFNFNYKHHIGKVNFIPDKPIHLSFDFNSKPYMTMLLIQLIKKDIGFEIRVFKEYCFKHPKNSTQALCEAFKSNYEDLRPDVYYYGDAMGEKRIEGKGDEKRFDDVRKFLKPLLSEYSKRTMGYNLSIIKRKEFMNNLLANRPETASPDNPVSYNSLLVDESCTELIADFENLLEDKDGEKWKQQVADPDNPQIKYEKHGHTSDSLEYFLSYIFKEDILKPKR